jgi:DNA modification methylase
MNQLTKNFVNQIHNCDAIVGMKILPDECIPLTVTSPPYDDLRHFGGYKWDFEVFSEMADELADHSARRCHRVDRR